MQACGGKDAGPRRARDAHTQRNITHSATPRHHRDTPNRDRSHDSETQPFPRQRVRRTYPWASVWHLARCVLGEMNRRDLTKLELRGMVDLHRRYVVGRVSRLLSACAAALLRAALLALPLAAWLCSPRRSLTVAMQ